MQVHAIYFFDEKMHLIWKIWSYWWENIWFSVQGVKKCVADLIADSLSWSNSERAKVALIFDEFTTHPTIQARQNLGDLYAQYLYLCFVLLGCSHTQPTVNNGPVQHNIFKWIPTLLVFILIFFAGMSLYRDHTGASWWTPLPTEINARVTQQMHELIADIKQSIHDLPMNYIFPDPPVDAPIEDSFSHNWTSILITVDPAVYDLLVSFENDLEISEERNYHAALHQYHLVRYDINVDWKVFTCYLLWERSWTMRTVVGDPDSVLTKLKNTLNQKTDSGRPFWKMAGSVGAVQSTLTATPTLEQVLQWVTESSHDLSSWQSVLEPLNEMLSAWNKKLKKENPTHGLWIRGWLVVAALWGAWVNSKFNKKEE